MGSCLLTPSPPHSRNKIPKLNMESLKEGSKVRTNNLVRRKRTNPNSFTILVNTRRKRILFIVSFPAIFAEGKPSPYFLTPRVICGVIPHLEASVSLVCIQLMGKYLKGTHGTVFPSFKFYNYVASLNSKQKKVAISRRVSQVKLEQAARSGLRGSQMVGRGGVRKRPNL